MTYQPLFLWKWTKCFLDDDVVQGESMHSSLTSLQQTIGFHFKGKHYDML